MECKDGTFWLLKPFAEAVWAWFEKRAVIPDWYGGGHRIACAHGTHRPNGGASCYRGHPSVEDMFAHVRECGHKFPSVPAISSVEHFGSSIDGSTSRVAAITGYLGCKCGQVSTELAVECDDLALGTVIAEVIAAGQLK